MLQIFQFKAKFNKSDTVSQNNCNAPCIHRSDALNTTTHQHKPNKQPWNYYQNQNRVKISC